MIRFKGKRVNGRLEITARYQNEEIYTRDIDTLRMRPLAGLAPMELTDRRSVTYMPGKVISLRERLLTGCTARVFLSFLAQLAGLTDRIGKRGLMTERLLLDAENIYVTAGDELVVLYVPSADGSGRSSGVELMRNMLRLYESTPMADRAFARDVSSFLCTQNSLDPVELQSFVLRTDPTVTELLTRKDKVESGFLTDKQQEYIRHYGVESGTVLVSDEEAGIDRADYTLFADSETTAEPPGEDDELTDETVSSAADGELTGGTMILDPDDEPSAFFGGDDDPNNKTLQVSDRKYPSARPEPSRKQTASAGTADVVPRGSEKTQRTVRHVPVRVRAASEPQQRSVKSAKAAPANEQPGRQSSCAGAAQYPVLEHIRSGAVITVDKPVFRIGKEKAYVDYFVSNNTTVSRSHLDIIRRGDSWFAKDLNSRNGTFINNRRLIRETENELRDGDILRISDEEYIFRK